MALSDKHTRFVDEYMIDMNATAAYRRAGYKAEGNAAEVNANRLLRNAKVQEEIAKRRKALSEKSELSLEWVISELAENHRTAKQIGELQASNKALELLGKHFGAFTDKVKMDVQGEVSHTHDYHIEQQITADPDTVELLKQLYKRQASTS